jgi:hypothetical protein
MIVVLRSLCARQSIAVCSCLYLATVSRQHYCNTRTGLVEYTDVQTGLEPVDCLFLLRLILLPHPTILSRLLFDVRRELIVR